MTEGRPTLRLAIDVERVVRLELGGRRVEGGVLVDTPRPESSLDLQAPLGGRIVAYVIVEDAAGNADAPIVVYVPEDGDDGPGLRLARLT